jgi:phage terminase large subunit-like protein
LRGEAVTAVDERPVLLGREEPRLWTRNLRPLTRANTHGWEAITFAETVLGFDLLPWQKWWLLHALELKQDGSYRFRTIVTLVGRQQGKTTLLKIVALWAMYLDRVHLVLGAAQSLDIARESWKGALDLARGNELLANELTRVTTGSIETAMTLTNGARYRITAATPGSGRGLSVDLLILDELREQRDWEAWSALSKTTIARPNALTVAISNAGDDKSVVLNSLRSTGLAETDESIALFEWSAPDGCALDDPDAWCQAMPGLGHGTITESAVRLALATDPESVFRTELLCQSVDALNPGARPARVGRLRRSRARHRPDRAACGDVPRRLPGRRARLDGHRRAAR